jgi:hypothetical protein
MIPYPPSDICFSRIRSSNGISREVLNVLGFTLGI